jgi:hypothetical protein
LITAVDVAPASEQDGPQAKHLVDAQAPSRRPGRLLGDTAYGTGPVRAELAAREVEVLAPVPEGHSEEGRLAKRDFEIDLVAGTVACPAGHSALIRSEPSVERLLGLLTTRYGARKSRYFGRAKARLQASWAAALVNLNPIARHLAAQTA